MSTMNQDFVKKFSPVWYNDPYFFGRVHVTKVFKRLSEAVASGYAITDVPVLDGGGEKIAEWFLAHNSEREFAFVYRP